MMILFMTLSPMRMPASMILIMRVLLLSQSCLIKMNDLILDLGLTKESAELLASRLKEKKHVEKGDASNISPK